MTPSLIRVEADEVTYNLHVMIRFDLELAMLEDRLAIKDLPEAWHARYEQDLGLRAPDDRDGVLQDVHWFGFSSIGGAFQGYSLGNIMSALFFEQALKQRPEITAQMAEGRFDALHEWLKENIYQHGRKYTPDELVERISGGPLSIPGYSAPGPANTRPLAPAGQSPPPHTPAGPGYGRRQAPCRRGHNVDPAGGSVPAHAGT